MSYESNIGQSDFFFAGEDKILSYEVFASDGVLMEDVSGWDLAWELRPTVISKSPWRDQGASVLRKTTGDGSITIDGVWAADRATNAQRVLVAIADVDTEALVGGRYVCALKRLDAGFESVLSHGMVELLVASTR